MTVSSEKRARWEMAPEVTVLMPVYQGLLVMPRALEALVAGQSIPLRLVLVDDGSTDGCAELLASATFRAHLRMRGFASVDVLPAATEPGRDPERPWDQALYIEHMIAVRRRLLEAVRTEWTWWVDQDVMVPVGAARTLGDALNRMCRPGLLGLLAEPVADHVRLDCAMGPTDVLREVTAEGWGTDGCECRWLHDELIRRGFTSNYVQGWQARHLRLEMGGLGLRPPPTEVDHHDLHVKVVGSEAARAVIKALEDLTLCEDPGNEVSATKVDGRS